MNYSAAMATKNIPWALIEQLLADKGQNRAWLREKLDVQSNIITNWKSRGVPRGRAGEVAALFGVTSDYLLQVPGATKDGIRTIFSHPLQLSNNVEPAPDIVATPRDLPVVGQVQAGPDGLLTIDDYPVGQGDGSVSFWAQSNNAYALRVRGESMSPRYMPGEFVAVDPSIEAQAGKECIVLLVNDQRLLKRLLWKREGYACFESINKDYKNITLPLDEIREIHFVIGPVPSMAFKPNR